MKVDSWVIVSKLKIGFRDGLVKAGLKSAACLLLILTPAAYAQDLDFSMSSDSLQLKVDGPFRNTNLDWNLDYLRNDDLDYDIYGAGVFVTGRSNASTGRQVAGLGLQLTQTDLPGPDGTLLAVGGYIHHTLAKANLVNIRGDILYAPSATSFNKVEKYLYFSLRVEYELLDAAKIYVGYRDVEIDVGAGDVNIDDGIVGGLVMTF